MQSNAVIENSIFDSNDPLLDRIPIHPSLTDGQSDALWHRWRQLNEKEEEENLTNRLPVCNAFHLDADILMFERKQERALRVLNKRNRTNGYLC